MLKARSVLTANNTEDLNILKEVIFIDLIDSGLVNDIYYYRDRVSPDGKARVDLTVEVIATETGRYPKGSKTKIQKLIEKFCKDKVYFC